MIRHVVSSIAVAGVLTLASWTDALAQMKNPCAPKNPCATKAANPCAAKNPCAPKNPCAATNPASGQKPPGNLYPDLGSREDRLRSDQRIPQSR
jgi:hypothetical protein